MDNEKIEIKRKHTVTLLYDDVLDDERLGKHEILVYMALCRFANNKTRDCFPSISTIAKAARLATSTAREAIRNLEKAGRLTITERTRPEGGQSSNLYELSENGIRPLPDTSTPPHRTPVPPPPHGGDELYSDELEKEGDPKSLGTTGARGAPEAEANPPPLEKNKQKPGLSRAMSDEAVAQRGVPIRWTQTEKDGVRKMRDKHGGEAVFNAWRDWLESGNKVSVLFFLGDTPGSDYRAFTPSPPSVRCKKHDTALVNGDCLDCNREAAEEYKPDFQGLIQNLTQKKSVKNENRIVRYVGGKPIRDTDHARNELEEVTA